MKKFFLLLLLVGCQQNLEYKKYKISVISPNGKDSYYYTVHSEYVPIPVPAWGGQIEFSNMNGQIEQWERTIVAPTGWGYTVEEMSE